MSATSDRETGRGMEIPKWFVWIMSGMSTLFLVLFVPWAGWVTMTLSAITVRMESGIEVRERVETMESNFHAHQLDPNVHASGFEKIKASVRGLELRVDRLESAN